MLPQYKFTRKWRIRINVKKSNVVPVSKFCTVSGETSCGIWNINGVSIPIKKKHKYLGVLLGAGNVSQDIVKEKGAVVIQTKGRVASVRKLMGESIAQVYVDEVVTPSVLYAMEMFKVPYRKIEE